jgi:hypothetical protein
MEVAFTAPCNGSTNVYQLDANGTPTALLSTPFAFMTAPDGGPCADKDTTVQLGLTAPGGWQVRYDDFTCDWSP